MAEPEEIVPHREWLCWAIAVVVIAGIALVLLLAPALPAERKCLASYYGFESGHHTANGEKFRPNGFSIALRSKPHGERYRVCFHGRCVIVRHNDVGPFVRGRCADLSLGTAKAIGLTRAGVGFISIEQANTPK